MRRPTEYSDAVGRAHTSQASLKWRVRRTAHSRAPSLGGHGVLLWRTCRILCAFVLKMSLLVRSRARPGQDRTSCCEKSDNRVPGGPQRPWGGELLKSPLDGPFSRNPLEDPMFLFTANGGAMCVHVCLLRVPEFTASDDYTRREKGVHHGDAPIIHLPRGTRCASPAAGRRDLTQSGSRRSN